MFERFKKYKMVSGLLAASAIFVLTGFIWALAGLRTMSGPMLLHFNDLQGITATGNTSVIVFAGIFGMVVVVLNTCLAFEFEERSPFFGKLTAVLTLTFAILLFIAFAAILSVN